MKFEIAKNREPTSGKGVRVSEVGSENGWTLCWRRTSQHRTSKSRVLGLDEGLLYRRGSRKRAVVLIDGKWATWHRA